VAIQLLEAAKVKSGSAEPHVKKVGSISWNQVKEIAEIKMSDLNCFTLESAMRMVAGTARSMGLLSQVILHLIKHLKLIKMARITKNRKLALEKIGQDKIFTLEAASKLVKEITSTKFDASVDIDVRLGVDPRKANQMVRGVVSLPHGTGKEVRVLALVTPDKVQEATEAGADYVGLDDYLEKIKGGWADVDVIITMPPIMGK
jgi:hypothetical protein